LTPWPNGAYDGTMARPKAIPESQDALAKLKAKRVEHLNEVAKLDALIAAVQAALGIAEPAPPQSKPASRARLGRPPKKAKPEKPAVHSPYYGMGLGEAGKKMLSLVPDKTPQPLKAIWAAIHSTGYTITAEKPISTLSWQLRKREERDHDVILVGDAKWALAAWYSHEELDRIRATRGKQPWRNREDHIERTLQGMKQAVQERGIRLGARRKITDELVAQIETRLNAQEDAGDIAKDLNIARSSIYAYFKVGRRDGRVVAVRKKRVKDFTEKAKGSTGDEPAKPLLKLVEVA
jgi:hypothetical protein